jgi:acylphosphatase
MGLTRLRVHVAGRVQGVGYRWFVRDHAVRLGVTGWVRNREDGTVELEAEGDSGVLEAFADVLRTGHAAARVTSLETKTIDVAGDRSFDIRR